MTTQNFKTDLQVVKFLIKQSGSSTWQLEKITGISRQTFDRWKKADSLDVRGTTMQDFAQKLGYTVKRNYNGVAVSPHNKEQIGELTMNQQNRLIAYQEAEIQQLKEQASKHETVYDGIQSDIIFHFDVKFNWSLKNMGIKVRYSTQDYNHITIMAQKLGYNESQIRHFMQIDEWAEYKNHNVHQLRTEEQKKAMLATVDKFMIAYNSIKLNTTLLIAEIPVSYNHKNGTTFKANAEYRVNWINGTGTAHIRWLKD